MSVDVSDVSGCMSGGISPLSFTVDRIAADAGDGCVFFFFIHPKSDHERFPEGSMSFGGGMKESFSSFSRGTYDDFTVAIVVVCVEEEEEEEEE